MYLLMASAILGASVLPFWFESMMRKPRVLVIYGVTTHRAIWMGCPWSDVSGKKQVHLEVISYHLNRNSGAVSVDGGRLCFHLRGDEVAISFLWLPEVSYTPLF